MSCRREFPVCAMFAAVGLLLSGLTVCSASTQENCFANNPRPFSNFGTRAAYEASGANLDPRPLPPPLQGCKPVQMWHLGRHGTRYGSEDDNKRMLKLVEVQKAIKEHLAANRTVKLCPQDLDNIMAWVPEADESLGYQLSQQGQKDMYELAQRLKSRFPDLLNVENMHGFEFKHDKTQRCIDSSKWFYKGLLGHFPDKVDGVDSFPDFYNRCPAFYAPLASEYINGQGIKFQKGPEMSAVITRISSKLGYYHNLDFELVRAMYDACSYELAWNWKSGKKSPWCALFQPEDFKVLEYWADTKEYYRTGHGHKIHEKLGCVAIKDLVREFKSRTDLNRASAPSALFYSSHDTLLNQVVAFLGLYRDADDLKADNFQSMEQRRWRVTKFSPFGANIDAVLHLCPSGERYRVQFFLNENLLSLDGCEKNGCTWSQFMAKFGDVPDKCKKKRLCWLPS